MQPNPLVQFFKQYIGQPVDEAPSPVARYLRGTLLAIEEGEVTMRFTVRPDLANPMGTLHGGMMATIIDEVIGIAVYSLNAEHFYTTVNLNVDYLGAAHVHDDITAQASIVRRGRNIVYVQCSVHSAEGKLLARATSNLLNTGRPHPAAFKPV